MVHRLGERVTCVVRGDAEPAERFGRINVDIPFAVLIEEPNGERCLGAAAARGHAPPPQRLGVVARRARAAVVRGTDVALRRDVALLCRHAPKAHCARRVARCPVAAVIHNAHVELSFFVATERGAAPVRNAPCFVFAQSAETVEEEAAHFKLAPNVPLCSGLAKPARGLGR